MSMHDHSNMMVTAYNNVGRPVNLASRGHQASPAAQLQTDGFTQDYGSVSNAAARNHNATTLNQQSNSSRFINTIYQ